MLDFENANEVFDVYGAYPHKERGIEHRLLGRFLIADGQLHLLEDHEGMLRDMLKNGPVKDSLRQLNALAHSSYVKVVSESDVTEGKHVELIPGGGKELQPDQPQPEEPPEFVEEQPSPPATMQTPPAVFDYFRVGMVAPQTLEVRGEEVFMNGHRLRPQIVRGIFRDIQTGLAKLRYKKGVV